MLLLITLLLLNDLKFTYIINLEYIFIHIKTNASNYNKIKIRMD